MVLLSDMLNLPWNTTGPLAWMTNVLRKLELRVIFFLKTQSTTWRTPQASIHEAAAAFTVIKGHSDDVQVFSFANAHRPVRQCTLHSHYRHYSCPLQLPSVLHTTLLLRCHRTRLLCGLSPAESRGVPPQSSWIMERTRSGSLWLLSAIITELCCVCCFFNLPPLCTALS